jgi:hypothetical protein
MSNEKQTGNQNFSPAKILIAWAVATIGASSGVVSIMPEKPAPDPMDSREWMQMVARIDRLEQALNDYQTLKYRVKQIEEKEAKNRW